VIRRYEACGYLLLAAGLAAGMLLGVGCSGLQAGSENEDDPQELVGAPPEDDEAFAYAGEPKETSRVEESGKLDEESEADEASDPEGQSEESVSGTGEMPEAGETDNEGRRGEADDRCFSCVRLCPADKPSCDASDGDVICGWGVHEEQETARQLARAECDGALEREREVGDWREISGECPPATCRSSSDE